MGDYDKLPYSGRNMDESSSISKLTLNPKANLSDKYE